jgi:APA family basic amino acid/polyamine antiporter
MSHPQATQLGFGSGVGLVVANMVGAGVFLSAGFMAQDLGPHTILLAWIVGAVLALAGARAYAELALLVSPRSGGEYRILHDLLHPAVGYLAGWASVLVGFSGPIAIDAGAAAAFLQTLFPSIPVQWTAAAIIVVVTLVHAFNLRVAKRTQNILVTLKATLIVGFVVLGLVLGSNHAPTWTAAHPSSGFPLAAFMGSLFFVGFAFSGWNAAIYSTGEFANPRRDVPRAMLVGCTVVGLFYLAINWVFVANLTPERAQVVFKYEESRITLGHLIARDILGPVGGSVMSALMVLVFISAISAMTFVGPRVYASMAADGFLPKALAAREGRPPVGSVLLQGALSLILVFGVRIQHMLQNLSAILILFSALTVSTLFVVRFRRGLPRPAPASLVAAAVYFCSAVWMLYFGFRNSTHLLYWVAAIFAVTLVAYAFSRFVRSRP